MIKFLMYFSLIVNSYLLGENVVALMSPEALPINAVITVFSLLAIIVASFFITYLSTVGDQ
jgi:hypothetical protein